MTEQPYPEGIDCAWVACDRVGQVGVFITGGCGPIPVAALRSVAINEVIEALLRDLPTISESHLLVQDGQRDHWTTLAQRGLFAFDWNDVHRAADDEIGAYELISAPVRPIKLDDLPRSLLQAAQTVTLLEATFAGNGFLDIRAHAETCEPEQVSG